MAALYLSELFTDSPTERDSVFRERSNRHATGVMTIYGLWVRAQIPYKVSLIVKYGIKVINKAGGLVYQRNFGGLSSEYENDVTI